MNLLFYRFLKFSPVSLKKNKTGENNMLIEKITKLIVPLIQKLINEVNTNMIDWFELEEQIIDFLNTIGTLIEQEIVDNINEPHTKNTYFSTDKPIWYSYKENRNLTFINRFGQEISKSRRCYESPNGMKCNPLDEKLGFTNCTSYSPLMTLLISEFGAELSFLKSSKLLSDALGFKISSTAVQNNTEHTGEIIPEAPKDYLSDETNEDEYDTVIVEVDGTTSPQIKETEGKTGRESLKEPTEYKECNIITVERKKNGKSNKIYGGLYSCRQDFREYCQDFTNILNVKKSKLRAFISDGLPSNWELANAHYPDFIHILDYYHATEHIHNFGKFFVSKIEGSEISNKLCSMLYEGKTRLVIKTMISNLSKIEKISVKLAKKEINYLYKNRHRMRYDKYRDLCLPIGSGTIEAACKLVVCRRFKGNGMRWKKKDNKKVLRVRLSLLNNKLQSYFHGNKSKLIA